MVGAALVMLYYFILISPLLLMTLRLLLTNVLIPHFKKMDKKKQLSQRSDWPNIKNKIHILELLYKKVHAKSASKWYRLLNFIHNKEFIYGEIDFLSFYTILVRVSPSKQDVFYDLGSGSGKAVLSAMWFFNVKKSIGIELLPPLYHQSHLQLAQSNQWFVHNQIENIQFINDSFLDYDFGDADIIYVAATCLNDDTWNLLISKMASLKPSTRIIVATRMIHHEQFECLYQGIELMSWGLCPVKIYKIKQNAI